MKLVIRYKKPHKELFFAIFQESRTIARKPRDAACFSYAQWHWMLFASAYERSRPL